MNSVELLYDCKNTLGEGITYSSINNNLYWLDINNVSKLFKLNLNSNEKEIFELPEIVTANNNAPPAILDIQSMTDEISDMDEAEIERCEQTDPTWLKAYAR